MVSHRGHGVHREIFIIRKHKFGREAGDEIIKQVASILINQQLENTDIIRSDGDEFIVYFLLPGDLRLRRLL